jgi:cytochrome c oxidase subunit 2
VEEPNHLRRIAIAWLILSAIATPVVVIWIAPSLPPWNGSNTASGQVRDNIVLFGIVTPIAALMIVYFAYALTVFRHKGGRLLEGQAPEEGAQIRGDARIQTPWIVITTVIVLFLAVFGTAELAAAGSGGGQGPLPVFKPSWPPPLRVQVIGQQWEFTYRFPTYGGVETPHLELPVGRQVEFHVTSLDVIHSFWAPKIGVKADANPGVDNIAYTKPTKEQSFDIRCNEVCGLWHGYMSDKGQVVSPARFQAWIRAQQVLYGPITPALPHYSGHYFPDPQRRAG